MTGYNYSESKEGLLKLQEKIKKVAVLYKKINIKWHIKLWEKSDKDKLHILLEKVPWY